MKTAILPYLIILLFCISCSPARKDKIIYSCNSYTVYENRVTQGKFKAIATSPNEIISNYQSPVSLSYSPIIEFKFSINSRDNELPIGENHKIIIRPQNGKFISPILSFGEKDSTGETNNNDIPNTIPANTAWTVRVDMNHMLKAFKEQGFYKTPTNDIIYSNDFKGLYIAGSGEPLTWDFENLYNKEEITLTDNDGNGVYETTIRLNTQDNTTDKFSEWKRHNNLNHYPRYQSNQLLIDALYNMALDELVDNIRQDGTFRAGAAWDGVWTRDISYSIWLALGYINPEASSKSLKAKVKNGRIVQDTGTGGAWPISSDRVVWSIAAWELYKITGDNNWLNYAFDVIQKSAQDDQYTIKDSQTGLMRGEQSYLDWREQSYPRWMQPIDIYQSLCLGTNVVHYAMYSILGQMAQLLGKDISPYTHQAALLKKAINQHLWMPEKGYYGEYLYNSIYPILSSGADNLGESLSILSNVASPQQAKQIISHIPITEFGTTSIFPQLSKIKPYHNNAIWPFVQAFWNLAAAKAENETAVVKGLGSLYRAAALFTTHKELFVASDGDYKGSAVNSDKMLWSLSGNIAMIYRLYFGMNFESDGIRFRPFVPSSINGEKQIQKFLYRDAILYLKLSGTGNKITEFRINGKLTSEPFFPANLTGKHKIEIVLANNKIPYQEVNVQNIEYMPETTEFSFMPNDTTIKIENYTHPNEYELYLNGISHGKINNEMFKIYPLNTFTQVAIVPTNNQGYTGFTGKPIIYLPPNEEWIIEAENHIRPSKHNHDGYSGKGYIETSTSLNSNITFEVEVPTSGTYYIDIRYANGNGPINTENKCAIRTLFTNGRPTGPIVMPQRGKDEWSNWGYSNPVMSVLHAGKNTISIIYIKPQDENMNGETNMALIDFIRLRKGNQRPLIRLFPPIIFPKND